jgi:hypothetical protein
MVNKMKVNIVKEVSEELQDLDISKHNDIVTTKYGNKILCETPVSKRYEVFDFSNWCLDKVIEILPQLDINTYDLNIRGGKQELILKSSIINIGDKEFQKRLYILSSSDRSRKLQINYALTNIEDQFTFIAEKGSFSRPHINGMNDLLNEKFEVKVDSFDEQIDIIDTVLKSDIQFSNVRTVVLGDEPSDSSKNKLTRLINRYERKYDVNLTYDMYVDTYEITKMYLNMFSEKDSHIIKKESKKISELTRFATRKRKLELLNEL